MTMNRERIQQALSGPIPSIGTPFNQDGGIDYAGLRKMVDFNIEAGSGALLITWGDSLFSLLRDQEIADITRAVIDTAAGRAAVVACTGRWTPPQVIEYAAFCREIGADILLVFPPFWYPGTSTPDDIVEYHAAIAAEIPVMANSAEFNRHGAAHGMSVATAMLEKLDNVLAIKMDVMGAFDRALTSLVSDRWTVFAGGTKPFHMELLPYGCQGYLSTFISFRPAVTHAYWRAITANDLPAAVRIIEQIDKPFFDYIMNVTGGFDAALHGVMEVTGLAKRWRRKPFYSLNDEEMAHLSGFLDGLAEAEKAIL